MRFRTFQFHGPNWLTDFAGCEWLVWLSLAEREALLESAKTMQADLADLLEKNGIEPRHLKGLHRPLPKSPRSRFAFLLNSTAIALQRHAGHEVNRARRLVSREQAWVRAVFETEDAVAGRSAGRVSLHLLHQVFPELKLTAEWTRSPEPASAMIDRYRAAFFTSGMPLETRALIKAAQQAGVPCVRLDQPPFRPRRDASRISTNGALLLGQGIHRHVIDGTLCLDRAGKAKLFIRDRPSIGRLLVKLGARLPFDGREPPCGYTLLQAVQATEKLGYPVVLKPARRARGEGVTLNVHNVNQLMQALSKAQNVSRHFMVERHIRGRAWKILVSNGKAVGLLGANLSAATKVEVASKISALAENIARQLEVGMLVMTVVTPDVTRPLEDTGGAVVDLDLAPDLDRVLKKRSKLWGPMIQGYLRWLYPKDAPARIPVIAIAGTNGKTTTSRMIDAIMRGSGFRTGLNCSDGFYLDGEKTKSNQDKDHLRKMFHGQVRNRRVELAVMEYGFSHLKRGGFPFNQCAIGVLTNVTADHLQPGWETVKQLAEIQGAVPRRARDGVVLNADDPHTDMVLQQVSAPRVALTSATLSLSEIQRDDIENTVYVVAEQGSANPGVVINERGKTTKLMRLDEIPATLGGLAGFNIENALQAIATGVLMNIPLVQIKAAMGGFHADFETTPGRLNIHDNGSFRVIMDHAHNADGFDKLCALTDRLDVSGRRILLFAMNEDRQDVEIEATVRAAAGHFDFYICRNYPKARLEDRDGLPDLMCNMLLKAGIPQERIMVCSDRFRAADLALETAKAGDLLVMTSGIYEMDEMWTRILAGPGKQTSA